MLILQILKIAGIILLSILGLFLLLILLLLVFPWRYRISGRIRGKEYEGELEVCWMLKAVFLKQYVKSGEEGGGTLRIFGLRLFRSNKEILEEAKKRHEERKPDPEVLRQVGSSSTLFEDPVQNELEKYHTDIQTETESSEKPAAEQEKISLKTIREMWKEGRAPQPEDLIRLLEAKLEELIERAVTFSRRQAKELVTNGKTVIVRLFNESQESMEKLRDLKELIFGEQNRKAMLLLLKIVRRVLRQVLPREGSGMLVYGVGDPYYTGKILEVLALLYPLYGEVVQVCPWFEEEKLEVDADVKGHIHLIVLLVCFIRVWFSRKLRSIYTEFKRIISYEQSE